MLDAVRPGAGYMTMAMAVAGASRTHSEFPEPLKNKGVSLRDLGIIKNLMIPEVNYGVLGFDE